MRKKTKHFIWFILLNNLFCLIWCQKFTYSYSGSTVQRNGDILSVGISLNKEKPHYVFKKVNINCLVPDKDGWYSFKLQNNEIYLIFGSNYFIFYNQTNPELCSFAYSEIYKKEYDDIINNVYQEYYERKKIIEKIQVPDFLKETINGKTIEYRGNNMEDYYVNLFDSPDSIFNPNLIPWATSKNPIGMKIFVTFKEPQNSIVILNGFVNPEKRYLYKANRRLRTIKVVSQESNFSFEKQFDDTVHFEEISFPKFVNEIEIEILDFYEGEKYKDLCVQSILPLYSGKDLNYESFDIKQDYKDESKFPK